MSLAILDAILAIDWSDIGLATVETLTMVGGSLFFTVLLGLPLGIVLFLTGPASASMSGTSYPIDGAWTAY